MNIMELGAIGELVGGVAVIATLIYLAAQVRQSNRLEKAESSRAATRDYINTMQWMDTQLFRRGTSDFGRLPKDDQMRFHNWLAAFFWIGQNEFVLSRSELVDETQTRTNLDVLAAMMGTPGIAEWWRTSNMIFSPDFVDYMGTLAEDALKGPSLAQALPWMACDDEDA